MPDETGDFISVLFPSLICGLTSCLLVSGLGALGFSRRFGDAFYRIFIWSIAGMTISAGGYCLFLLSMVFIIKDSAYRGQGLGIALNGVIAVNGPIIFASLGAILGGALRFILLNIKWPGFWVSRQIIVGYLARKGWFRS
jgi:hypothetical protein